MWFVHGSWFTVLSVDVMCSPATSRFSVRIMKKTLLRIVVLILVAVTARAYPTFRVVRSLRLTSCLRTRPSPYHDDNGVLVACRMTKSTAQHQQHGKEQQQQQPFGNIVILDHLNINHEMGRHDWLKAFYFDFLSCAIDPRKQENLEKGRNTVWANIGAHQFHLPEGKPDAQVLQGIITLVYPNLDGLMERYEQVQPILEGSLFTMVQEVNDEQDASSSLQVADPWGTKFRIVKGDALVNGDFRGKQPGGVSEGLALRDVTLFTKKDDTNMEGIARFYDQILGAPTLECTAEKAIISVGPFQTLTFMRHPGSGQEDQEKKKLPEKVEYLHVDLRDDHVESPMGFPTFLSNYGPHISMYVADLAECYRKASDLNLVYVNPRFKRRAYTLDQALDDCMFRCLDIVDPDKPEDGIILQLEHEVRSVVKRDGSMYRSCPFDDIPAKCIASSTD